MNTMITFENERRKYPGLKKGQICQNNNIKSSSFDRIQKDLSLPHSLKDYFVHNKIYHF